MGVMRSNRTSAVLLSCAAVLGLVLANGPLAEPLHHVQHLHVGPAAWGLDLSVGHWISDGILAVFFFLVAIELKHEFTVGDLNSVGKALRPAIAALGGIVVPIVIYLVFTWGSGFEDGWPIPTATDIAFALGLLAMVGRGLPTAVRAFLLALAVLDDLAGILFIAVFFTSSANLLLVGVGAVLAALFGVLSVRYAALVRQAQRPGRPSRLFQRRMLVVAMILIALATWVAVYQSGIHATIAGVALGFAMHGKPAHRVRYLLEPLSNVVILPVFAFSAALVTIPPLRETALEAPFWGILVALPLGKIVGITGAALLADWLLRKRQQPVLQPGDLLAAGALGGIGFTVSLLMNELAFADRRAVADQGVLAVVLGSAISILVAVVIIRLRAGHHRRAAAHAGH